MPPSSVVRDTDHRDTRAEEAVEWILTWYAANSRELPWRSDDRTPWGVLVSEVMLQQTPVSRVEPIWVRWMQRWPSPKSLADEPVAEVIRAWQGLGYPRRALALHRAAGRIVDAHGGEVPDSPADLRALPGVGDYTAAAVRAFAYGQACVVLDTNVRRVLARWLAGRAHPQSSSATRSERLQAEGLWPDDVSAAAFSVAVMELGALVCTARTPACGVCPIRTRCGWLGAGQPAGAAPARQSAFDGSDRQARGFLLRTVSASAGLEVGRLSDLWDLERRGDPGARDQAERALASLDRDGLVRVCGGVVTLP